MRRSRGHESLTGAGACVVDAVVGIVTLTGTPTTVPFVFDSWSGATCTGAKAANVVTFTAPAADGACTADFTI